MAQPTTLGTKLRSLLIRFSIGIALGVVVWELIGRKLLAFKFGSIGSSVTCAPDVNLALSEFDSGLRIAALTGGVGFVILSVVVSIAWSRRNASAKGG